MKRLCAGLLTLLLLLPAGVTTAAPAIRPATFGVTEPFTLSGYSLTKIDLSAPENEEYRDWLSAYYVPPSGNTAGWMSERVEPLPLKVERVGPKDQNERITWDWNDSLELVRYECKDDDGSEDHQLYAREKATGKMQIIREIRNDNDCCTDSWVWLSVTCVEPSYVIYDVSAPGYKAYYFYAPGIEEPKFIGHYSGSGFIDDARSKWWYIGYNDGRSSTYYLDLEKLAAGDADAQREVLSGETYYYSVNHSWMAKRGGRDVACYWAVLHYPKENGDIDRIDPYYIVVYDPEKDRIEGFIEVPQLTRGWPSPEAGLKGMCHYFESVQASAYFERGEELDLSGVEFYVIDLG